MNIEMIKENLSMNKYIGQEKKRFLIEGDINVPDIKPDILSLINYSGRVYITKKEVIENKVKIEGIVEVCIIYLADDEIGSLRGINNTFNFTEYIDIQGVGDNSIVKLKCLSGTLECKVVNGRRVSIKMPVLAEVMASKTVVYEIGSDISYVQNVELKKEELNFKTMCNCKCENVSINETINLGEDKNPISEILQADIQIVGIDYKTSYNKILAKAEAVVKIIYVADDEKNSIETFETKVPVMSFIDVDKLSENCEINLDYAIKYFNIKPVYHDLKATTINLESEIEVCAYLYDDISFNIISDLYSTETNLICDYDDINILETDISLGENVEIIQSLLIPELDYMKILDITANPVISEINILDEKIALEGNIEFDILYYRNDKNVLENKKMELPLGQVIKIKNLEKNTKPEIDIKIENLEYKAIGGNQIQIRLILKIDVLNNKKINFKTIKNIEIISDEQIKVPNIVIYYVKKGDSLWNIAKNFKTTVEDIKNINELTDDIIYPNQQLIIKRKRAVNKIESLL